MKNDKYVVHIYNVCNVLMHEKMKPFILLLTLACIVSCGSNRRANAFLSHIDTLYQQNPAEAIIAIDSFMSCHNGMSQHNRMLLTLYRLRAQNSVGEPFASDSLARKVVEYFDDNGSVEEQMSACLEAFIATLTTIQRRWPIIRRRLRWLTQRTAIKITLSSIVCMDRWATCC